MTTRPRVALVGCGRRLSSSLWPVLAALGARPVLVVEPQRTVRNRLTSRLPNDAMPALVDSLTREILEETAPDAVIISSPNGLHFEHAHISLSVGIPTFVEKPMACTAEQAYILQLLGGAQLVVSEQRMHRADLRLAWSAIHSNQLGRIHEISYRDAVAPAPSLASSWRNDPKLAGGGVLLDLGYHTVSALQWLLGSASDNFIISAARLQRKTLRVEEYAEVRCTSGEVEIAIRVGLDSKRPGEFLTVRGSSGRLCLKRERKRHSPSIVRLRKSGQSMISERLFSAPAHDSRSIRDFMAGRIDPQNLSRHVQIVRFLERVYRKSEVEISSCR